MSEWGYLDEREVSSGYDKAEPKDPEALVEVDQRKKEGGHNAHTHGQANGHHSLNPSHIPAKRFIIMTTKYV